MAINRTGNNLIYGMNNPLAVLPQENIRSRRAPTAADSAEIGTVWLYITGAVPQLYMYTAPSTWTQIALDDGSTVFDSLTVNGPTELNSSVDIVTGNAHVTIDAGTNDININADVITLSPALEIDKISPNNYDVTVDAGNGTIDIGGSGCNVIINPGSLGSVSCPNFNSFSLSGNYFEVATNTLVIGQNGNVTTFQGHIKSQPAVSHSYNTNLTRTLTSGTAVQLSYQSNVIANICVTISSATSAVINIGVGASATPTVDAATSTFTVASTTIMNFSVMVPYNYYLLVSTTGTISISNITVFYTGI